MKVVGSGTSLMAISWKEHEAGRRRGVVKGEASWVRVGFEARSSQRGRPRLDILMSKTNRRAGRGWRVGFLWGSAEKKCLSECGRRVVSTRRNE